MDTFFSRNIKKSPIGEDVFGEEFSGREVVYDP